MYKILLFLNLFAANYIYAASNLTLTKDLESYLDILVQNQVISLEEIEKFISQLDVGKISNPLEPVAGYFISSMREIHFYGLKNYYRNLKKLAPQHLLAWARQLLLNEKHRIDQEKLVITTVPNLIIDLAMSSESICAIKAVDQKIKCWRPNLDYQKWDPKPEEQNLEPVLGASLGLNHMCVILAGSQKLKCWGDNSAGQLNIPSQVDSILSISTNRRSTCVVSGVNKQGLCWGEPFKAIMSRDPIVELKASDEHVCGIMEKNRQVECWGSNGHNVLEIPKDLGVVKAISSGLYFMCAVKSDTAKVKCWGSSYAGVLRVPESLRAVSAIASGYYHSCAIKAEDRHVECWGGDRDEQTMVPKKLGAVTAIYAGGFSSCATKAEDGALVCWGAVTRQGEAVPSELSGGEGF